MTSQLNSILEVLAALKKPILIAAFLVICGAFLQVSYTKDYVAYTTSSVVEVTVVDKNVTSSYGNKAYPVLTVTQDGSKFKFINVNIEQYMAAEKYSKTRLSLTGAELNGFDAALNLISLLRIFATIGLTAAGVWIAFDVLMPRSNLTR